jgi:hypothetical protein
MLLCVLLFVWFKALLIYKSQLSDKLKSSKTVKLSVTLFVLFIWVLLSGLFK